MRQRYPGGTGSVAAIFGHPLHPMLIPFPIAFLVGALGTDLMMVATGDPFFARASIWLIGAGLATGVLAGLLGIVDLIGIRRARSRVIGWLHGILNLIALGLSFVNLLIRRDDIATSVDGLAIGFSAAVVLILLVTGWLGGELSYRHGVAVSREVGSGAPLGEDELAPRSRYES